MDDHKQVTLVSHGTRQANSARGPFTIYEATDTEGVTWQLKKPVYEEVIHLIGRPLHVTFSVKQNGNFTNSYLNSVIAELNGASSGYTQAMPAQGMPIGGASLGGSQSVGGQTFTPPPQADTPPPAAYSEDLKQQSIHRQVAAKVSATIFVTNQDPSLFWRNVEDLFNYFQTGELPTPF